MIQADRYMRNNGGYRLEVSDFEILRYHDSRTYTYHDCENYHDYHIMLIFSTSKLYKTL